MYNGAKPDSPHIRLANCLLSADLRLCIINLCCVLFAFSFITTDICIQRWVINPRGPNANYGPLRLIRKHAAKTFVWTAV
jgi:hypothetical protein